MSLILFCFLAENTTYKFKILFLFSNFIGMKKLLGLVLTLVLLMGCDDGDLTVENIDFTTINTSSCGNIIYKINGSELLILNIPQTAFETVFLNEPTAVNAPRTVLVNSANQIIYRGYDGTVNASSFCTPIPPASPVVNEEWKATDGNIEVRTIAVIEDNTDLDFVGGEKINKYRHSILVRNLSFLKPDGTTQIYANFTDLGNFDRPAVALPFAFDTTLEKCPSSNIVYNFVGRETLRLSIDPNLIINAETPAGSPRTGLLSSTLNKLDYYIYNENGDIDANLFCAATPPATPTIIENWTALDGVSGISGIIEVTTSVAGAVFEHEIHIKNAVLRRGNVQFKLADNYFLGTFTTTN